MSVLPFKCDCGGSVKAQKSMGRTFRWASDVEVMLPDDLVLPFCTSCAEFQYASDAPERLRNAVEPVYQALRRKQVAELRATIPMDDARLERALRVTSGYLESVLEGRTTASGMLVALLRQYAKHPEDAEDASKELVRLSMEET